MLFVVKVSSLNPNSSHSFLVTSISPASSKKPLKNRSSAFFKTSGVISGISPFSTASKALNNASSLAFDLALNTAQP